MAKNRGYQEWLRTKCKRNSMGQFMEPYEANPDGLAVGDHEVTLQEEVMRSLLDNPIKRLAVFGPLGEAVFDAVFLRSLTYREAGARLGKSHTAITRAVKGIRRALRAAFKENEV